MKTQFFIIISILGWGFGSFLYKLANNTIHPVLVSTFAMGLYTILLPLMWVVIKFDHTVTVNGVVYTLIGSLCMCVASLGYSYALRSGGQVGSITFVTALYPVLTLTLSMIFLHETMSIKQWCGVVLAIGSFLLLNV